MNPERRTERTNTEKIGGKKEIDKTLFEGFFNFKPLTPERLKEISEYKEKLREFKEPFTFEPNEKRKMALKMLNLEAINPGEVIELIEDSDLVVRDVGIDYFLPKIKNLSKENIGNSFKRKEMERQR